MNILLLVLIATISYFLGKIGFKNVKIALSIISKEHVAMPLSSALIWIIILLVPYILLNKYLPEKSIALYIGYLGALLNGFKSKK